MTKSTPTYLGYPFRFDHRGRTAITGQDDHIHDLIEQVLFTAPGERVNRPDFGCGLGHLVFAPMGDELLTATEFLVQGALQRWLGEVIQVEGVDVKGRESALTVTVQYTVRRNQERRVDEFVGESSK